MSVNNASVRVQMAHKETTTSGSRQVIEQFDRGSLTNFGIGSGAGQINNVWGDYRTLGGASENLDLAGGVTNGRGVTKTFANVKAIYIENPTGNDPLVVGGAASNPWNGFFVGTVSIPGGGRMAFATEAADGVPVVAGTGDILKVAGTTGNSYHIGIEGE